MYRFWGDKIQLIINDKHYTMDDIFMKVITLNRNQI